MPTRTNRVACLLAVRNASSSVANPEVSVYDRPERSTRSSAGFLRNADRSAARISPELSTVTRPCIATMSFNVHLPGVLVRGSPDAD
jgi:hypothetical protein